MNHADGWDGMTTNERMRYLRDRVAELEALSDALNNESNEREAARESLEAQLEGVSSLVEAKNAEIERLKAMVVWTAMYGGVRRDYDTHKITHLDWLLDDEVYHQIPCDGSPASILAVVGEAMKSNG